ncbi:hypothetical protein D3C81_885030 [compost metagenome]
MALGVRWCQGAACSPYLALLASTIKVEQPAGDKEQWHGQAGDGHQDAPGQAKVAAYVQRINAGQQLRLERLVGVAIVFFHLAVGRVDGQGVERTFVLGAFKQVEEGRRLSASRWQSQVVAGHGRAGGGLQVAPDGIVVDHQRFGVFARSTTWAPAAFATLVLLAGSGAIGQQLVQAFAVPLIGPEQAGEGEQQIEQQAPGAEYRMQVPVEGPALLGPVQSQPDPPVQRLARPAQVQAGETEENQHERAGAGDLSPGVAHGQETVQLQHQVEEALTGNLALQLAGIRIGIAHQAPAFTGRRGEEDACRLVALWLDPEHGDLVTLFGLDLSDQFGHRQNTLLAYFDFEHVGVEQLQQLILERPDCPGDTHQRQHQAGGDTEEPVQLKQRFLHHIDHLVLPQIRMRRALCLDTQKPRSPK